LARHFSH